MVTELSLMLDRYTQLIANNLGVDPKKLTLNLSSNGISVTAQQLDTDKGFRDLYVTIYLDKDNVSTFRLEQLPGCCGVVVSTGAYIQSKYRGKHLGKLLNKCRQDLARLGGYTVILCTDVDTNEVQKAILNSEGWEHLKSFTNRRTKNKVNIHLKHL